MNYIEKIKLNYRSWILVGIGTLMVVFILIPQNKKTITKTVPSYNLAEREPEPDFEAEIPTEVKWFIDSKQLPETVANLSVEKLPISQAKIDTILETFGFGESDKTSENNGVIFYGNKAGDKMVMVDKQTNQIEYGENIDSGDDFKGEVKIGSDEIKGKASELILGLLGNKNLQTSITEEGYKKVVYPRLVTTDEKSAQVVELVGNYTINQIPIRLFTDFPIRASYSMGGRLIKLKLQVPPEISLSDDKFTLMTLEQIKRQPVASYKIWKVEGGASLDLSSEIQIIKRVNATDLSLGYIYDQKGTLWPYYFVIGNSFPEVGPVKITMIISAVDKSQQ